MADRTWTGPEPGDITAWLIVQVGHTVGRRFWASLASVDLTPIQFGVLLELDRTPDASNAHLARTVLVTPQAMSELLTSLEQDALIERDHSGGRGRRVPTRLTPAGRDRLRRCDDIIGGVEESLGLDPQERRQLRHLVGRILLEPPLAIPRHPEANNE